MGYTLSKHKAKPIKPVCIKYGTRPLNRAIPNWDDPAKWKGKPCYVIGGGPSFKDFNFDLIKDELTIGTNKTCLYYNTTINYCMDIVLHNNMYYVYKKTKPKLHALWIAYTGEKVFLDANNSGKYSELVSVIPRIKNKAISFDLKKGIFGGNNSGLGALMLAIALRCNPIYLLGYDLKTTAINTHWHEGYDNDNVDAQSRRLERFKHSFVEMAPAIKAMKVDVINLTPDSALDCFETKDISEVIKENTKQTRPIYVAFYTIGTPYEQESRKLIASLDKYALDYDVVGVKNTGSWDDNTHLKPQFLLDMLKKHKGRPIVYVDCDAVIDSYPTMFDIYHDTIGVPVINWSDYRNTSRIEMLSGTIYIPNTDESVRTITLWKNMCDTYTKVWDQKLLEKVIGNHWIIDDSYCNIFDLMNVSNPIITHYQASRKFKKQV